MVDVGPAGASSNGSSQNNSNSGEEDKRDERMFECNICLDTAKDAVISMCGHLFCWPCLHQWLETRPARQMCPVCKAAISKEKVIPLYGRGSSKQEDPRNKAPPRPAGQRSEPEANTMEEEEDWWADEDSDSELHLSGVDYDYTSSDSDSEYSCNTSSVEVDSSLICHEDESEEEDQDVEDQDEDLVEDEDSEGNNEEMDIADNPFIDVDLEISIPNDYCDAGGHEVEDASDEKSSDGSTCALERLEVDNCESSDIDIED